MTDLRYCLICTCIPHSRPTQQQCERTVIQLAPPCQTLSGSTIHLPQCHCGAHQMSDWAVPAAMIHMFGCKSDQSYQVLLVELSAKLSCSTWRFWRRAALKRLLRVRRRGTCTLRGPSSARRPPKCSPAGVLSLRHSELPHNPLVQ